MKERKSNNILSLITIIGVGVISYLNSLKNAFVFDDLVTIVHNPYIKNLADIGLIWQMRPSRFIANLTFAVNYYFGGLNPLGYHLVNLSIHILTGFSVFFLIKYLIKILYPKKVKYANLWLLPLLISLLFISHPVQTQSVTFITQRYTSLSALFYLLSMIFFLKAFLGKQQFLFFYVISLLFTFFALFTKENTYTLPLSIILLIVFFLQEKMKERKRLFITAVPYFLLSLIIYYSAFLLPQGKTITSIGKQPFNLSMTKNITITTGEYLLTELNVIRTYIGLLILPINQNVDYDYPLSHSLFEIPTLLSLIFLILLLGAAIRLFPASRLISFGIIFFFITLLVESSIIPIEDVIFEHRLYLPSVGFVIVIASLLISIFNRRNNKYLYLTIFLIISAFSFATTQRNKVWKNEYTLWQDAVKKSPNKARVHYNLGVALGDMGKFTEAARQFEKTIQLDKNYVDAYHNLGAIFEKNGDWLKAQDAYQQALSIAPTNNHIHNSLGVLFAKQGKLDEARREYEYILQSESENFTVLNNLGVIYSQQNKLDDAIILLQRALKIVPDYENALYNLGSAYLKLGKIEAAFITFEQLLTINPKNATAYYYLGLIKVQKKDIAGAISSYQKALELNPDFIEAKKELVTLLSRN